MSNLQAPLLSVCMVTYNHENYIEKAIQSALDQRVDFDYEICIGEDSSSDKTGEICQTLASKYPDKIRLWNRSRQDVIFKNGQPTGIFNFLETLQACQGEYIALLEGDDLWVNNEKLQFQVKFLEENPSIVACYHDCIYLDELGNEITIPNKKVESLGANEVLGLSKLLESGSLAPTASLVFRKNAIFPLPTWYTKNPSDWKIEIMLALSGELVRLNNKVWSAYRIHSGGLWTGQTILNQVRYKEAQVTDLRLVPELIPFEKSLNRYLENAYLIGFEKLKSTSKIHALILIWKFSYVSQLASYSKLKWIFGLVRELIVNSKAVTAK